MTDKKNLAVVGATSLKGEAFIAKLAASELEFDELFLLDDESKAGEHVEFGRKDKLVHPVDSFDFAKVSHVVFTGDAALTEQVHYAVNASGCPVIDASGFLGQQDNVSLATLIDDYSVPAVVAVPEATTLQLWVVLQPLLQETSIASLSVTMLQCAAVGGKEALEDLGQQTARLLNFQEMQTSVFDKQLAFNVIPRVGELLESGDTDKEATICSQLVRLLALGSNDVDVSMLWSSVFYGDVINVSLQTRDAISLEYLTEQWQANPLLQFTADQVQTPVTTVSGKNVIALSKVRARQTSNDNTGLTFCAMAAPIQLSATATLLVLKNQLLG